MNFEYYLYQYLLKNQKAEVPDFGVFELTKESAKIDAENSMIIPPKESIDFQYQPMVFDNQLAKYIADETNSNLFTTQANLKIEVAKWIEKLKSNQTLSLENLGQFQFDEHKNVVKIRDNEDDIFGLETINLQTLKNPARKQIVVSGDYAFNKNVIWTFLGLIILGSAALFLFGDQQLIFGESSQIPTKKIVKKAEPINAAIHKQDSIKQDSIKPIKNAHIQKINR
ncbi:hypothetical protein LUD75_04445 [Epilithonimonas sp. JDS]|uniref:HU domain-containing protein n=1 Tax=Epilithonimonas sp. JDS TaxID=2902797 RepID=UPI001E349285|nr:hypothetical protein [Epilithonimonas sp. JDS]MCD9853939.1 hypothetical protein [Epilithonimonas sp. JDS]